MNTTIYVLRFSAILWCTCAMWVHSVWSDDKIPFVHSWLSSHTFDRIAVAGDRLVVYDRASGHVVASSKLTLLQKSFDHMTWVSDRELCVYSKDCHCPVIWDLVIDKIRPIVDPLPLGESLGPASYNSSKLCFVCAVKKTSLNGSSANTLFRVYDGKGNSSDINIPFRLEDFPIVRAVWSEDDSKIYMPTVLEEGVPGIAYYGLANGDIGTLVGVGVAPESKYHYDPVIVDAFNECVVFESSTLGGTAIYDIRHKNLRIATMSTGFGRPISSRINSSHLATIEKSTKGTTNMVYVTQRSHMVASKCIYTGDARRLRWTSRQTLEILLVSNSDQSSIVELLPEPGIVNELLGPLNLQEICDP